jgi:phage baseplate assembly protein W
MASISVRLPLALDDTDGFGMIKTLRAMIKQNLKMLILTNPGERVMEPEFGVGIKQFLFQNFSSDVYSQIDFKIREQVGIYMPLVSIREVNFYSIEEDSNETSFRLVYSIPSIAVNDLLEITI